MGPLEHNSEICFTGLNKKVFIFMSMEATSDSLHPELTTKYTVSKVYHYQKILWPPLP